MEWMQLMIFSQIKRRTKNILNIFQRVSIFEIDNCQF